MAQSTWTAKTETWATDPHTWANTTYSDSVILNATGSITLGYNTKYPVTANLTQLNLSKLNEEDAIKLASAILGTTSSVSAFASVTVPVSAVLSNTQTIKNNVNFEESISIALRNSASSDNNFLWNDEPEDTATVWVKIADPDE